MGKSWTGIGLGLGGAPLLRRGPHISTAAKLLLDLVPGADLLYMPSLQLSREIQNSVELRRTSDQAEQEFTPKQWQDSDVVAFADGGNARATKVFDWSGNGNTGTQTTAAAQPFAVTEGVLEEGLRFDGGQVINTGSSTIGNGLFAAADRQWTVSAWAKLGAGGASRSIIARAASSSANRTFNLWLQLAAGGYVVTLRGVNTLILATAPEQGFLHFTITWDGASAFARVDAGSPIALTVGTADEEASASVVAIGARRVSSPDTFWNGNIAFAGIWPRALTQAEIETVKNLTDPR